MINDDKSICIVTFFSDSFQYSLKERIFGESRFENSLSKYKELFFYYIKTIDTNKLTKGCTACKCKNRCVFNEKDSHKIFEYLKNFAEDIEDKYDYIDELFTNIIKIYITAVGISRPEAICLLKEYIKNNCNNYNINNALSFSKPLFRVREKGDYNPTEIHELFHVPFNKRYLIGNQRFGLPGTPCLYVSESLETALNETGININNANVALFLPKYSSYYNDGLCNIKNEIFENIVAIKNLINSGSEIEYDNEYFTFNKNDIKQHLARFVLSQILQFPVQKEYSSPFTQEYVIPQLLMDIVKMEKWKGIIYKSSKQIIHESSSNDSNSLYENICFTIPYCNSDYNDEILNKFYYATWWIGSKICEYEEFLFKLKQTENLIKKGYANGYNMNDYSVYIHYINTHIENMKNSTGIEQYYNGETGKVELTLFCRLLENFEPIVKEPWKYGIITYDKLSNLS